MKWNEFIIRQRQTVVTESHPVPREHFSIVISPSPLPYHRKYSWVTITQQEAETNGLHGWLDRQTDRHTDMLQKIHCYLLSRHFVHWLLAVFAGFVAEMIVVY